MNSQIVIDSKKCIGCKTCEVVCSVGHTSEKNGNDFLNKKNFHPRIRIIKLMHQFTASVCHQCEDAPCTQACQTKALVRGENFVETYPENCIGCRACLLACPFGVIELEKKAHSAPTSCLDLGQQFQIDIVKCDLCNHREQGPACVEFCPQDALIFVSDNELSQLTAQRRKNSILHELPTTSY
ncbi:4Fe-4S dicluster domain-containing protein [Proteus terrae]|uniref:4Fe-4S dicluster domain-containing protein n=1 Tax=Proteus terrae TaxID=1574161 RepID=UPI0021BA3E31|nr:4Fe-4S dicluster domain-containing protein [Proteus terrae]MCT8262759.1 4Fe-4S dicluster domain-containing protein [Proteus terrae]